MPQRKSRTGPWLSQNRNFLALMGFACVWTIFVMFTNTGWTFQSGSSDQPKQLKTAKMPAKVPRHYDAEELDESTCFGVTPDIAAQFNAVYGRTDCANVTTVVIDRLRQIGFGYHFLTLSDTHVTLLKRGILVLFEQPVWKYSTPECKQNTIHCTFEQQSPCQINELSPEHLCRVDRRWGYPEDHWVACFDGDRGRLSDVERAKPSVRFWIRNLLRLSENLQSQILRAKQRSGWPASGTTFAIHIRQGQKEGPDHVRLGKRLWDVNLTATTAAALALKWNANAVLLVSDDHAMTEQVQAFSRSWKLADGKGTLPKIMTTGDFAAGEVGVDCVRENYFQNGDCGKEEVVRRQALSAMIDFFLPAIHAQHFAGTMGSEFSMGISYYMREHSPTVDLDTTTCAKVDGGGRKCILKPWETYRGRCTVPEPETGCVRLKGLSTTVCV